MIVCCIALQVYPTVVIVVSTESVVFSEKYSSKSIYSSIIELSGVNEQKVMIPNNNHSKHFHLIFIVIFSKELVTNSL